MCRKKVVKKVTKVKKEEEAVTTEIKEKEGNPERLTTLNGTSAPAEEVAELLAEKGAMGL